MKTKGYNHCPVPWARTYDTIERCATRPLMRMALGKLSVGGEGVNGLYKHNGPAIIAPRHFSWWDIPAVAAAAKTIRPDMQLHFIAKKELDLPVIGDVFEGLGAHFIDRSKGLQQGTRDHVGMTVKRNGLPLVYPEGTRSKEKDAETGNWRMGRVKSGAARLALQYGLPVVPVGIEGTKPDHKRGVWVAVGNLIPPPLGVQEVEELGSRELVAVARQFSDDIAVQLEVVQEQARLMAA